MTVINVVVDLNKLINKTMKQKYIRLTWNGGRTLELKWVEYINNRKYWDAQQCVKEEYWA